MLTEERIIEIAKIMAEQAERGFLYREQIVIAYPEACQLNDRLGLSVDRRIIKVFNKITGDRVVWEPSLYYWRPRQSDDIPGRNQGFAARAKYFSGKYKP